MKYAFIQQRITEANDSHGLGAYCRALAVSRSGFYQWAQRNEEPDPETVALEVTARAAHARGRECYGPNNTIRRHSVLGNLSPLDFTQSFVNPLKMTSP